MTTTTATISPASPAARRGLNAGLWVAQGLLAFAFLAAGVMKLTAPIEQLAEGMAWVEGPLGGVVRFIGLAELLGAIGVVLPAALRIKPALTPAAAGGLLTVMVLAAGTHVAMGDVAGMVPALVLGALAAFVVWGRTKAAPIHAR